MFRDAARYVRHFSPILLLAASSCTGAAGAHSPDYAADQADALSAGGGGGGGTGERADGASNGEPSADGMIPPPAMATFPIRVSDNRRFFVGANGAPFLYHADTAWGAPYVPTPSDVTEYLNDRQAKGFTVIQTWVVGCDASTPNYAGETPFNGAPFDVASINEQYFANFDSIITKAASRNMLIVASPAWFGADGMCNRGKLNTTNAAAWGRWLARRYKSTINIAWIMAGDNNVVVGDSDMTQVVRAMANAIKAEAPHHLITLHAQGGVSSGEIVHGEAWLDFNMSYEYQFTAWHTSPRLYPQFHADYRRTPTKPFVLGESHYDWPEPGQEWIGLPIRRQAYWAVLSGSAGHAYGQRSTMDFGRSFGVDWREGLNTDGAIGMKHLKSLFSTRAWEKLAPDLDHRVMTSGYQSAAAYAPIALATDGTFALAYLPRSRTVTVDMSKFSGPVKGMWFDPTNATTQVISGSPFMNSGSRSFTSPESNAKGDSDWVLILEK
jgi:hypothetical protein